MGASNYVHLEECVIVAETGVALLINYQDSEYWIPKSQIADEENYSAGDEGVTISITEWIAEQKGISTE